ncbi:hypothetical protein EVAR_52419_1 [Eumeta japonica]|uniref:Uncharacterized protein n=1 Tax=Eumeta variegata TaxID=151549 RepID=A0A4C1YGU9_EUMVA|nr:hypothetical protein EVAR_52419_1 [Eumeta japonica]
MPVTRLRRRIRQRLGEAERVVYADGAESDKSARSSEQNCHVTHTYEMEKDCVNRRIVAFMNTGVNLVIVALTMTARIANQKEENNVKS